MGTGGWSIGGGGGPRIERRRVRILLRGGALAVVLAWIVTGCRTSVPRGLADCPLGIVQCGQGGNLGMSVALCDPTTGQTGSCVPPRNRMHEGDPCELMPGATWQRIPEPDSLPSIPGVACLPPNDFTSYFDAQVVIPLGCGSLSASAFVGVSIT